MPLRSHPATPSFPTLDRIHIAPDLIVLTDGAGGIANSAHAVDTFLTAAATLSPRTILDSDGRAAVAFLHTLDRTVSRSRHGGECTAVILAFDSHHIAGASIGDSIAWIITHDTIVDLTEHQHRRPLLGSGHATATAFTHAITHPASRVLVATDGLWKYAPRDRIAATARHSDLEHAADQLVDVVRLTPATFHDDVAFALLEPPLTDHDAEPIA